MTESQKRILYQLIGKKINGYISEVKKIRQIDLARNLKISRSSLSNVLSGNRQLSLHLLYDISRILNIEPTDLLPTIEELNEYFNVENQQFHKMLEQKGISQSSQATILKIINQTKEEKQ